MEGCFIVDRLLGLLEDILRQALHDAYQGLWATGDMSREIWTDPTSLFRTTIACLHLLRSFTRLSYIEEKH